MYQKKGVINRAPTIIEFEMDKIMAEAFLNIKQRGNDLGIRLPAAVKREAHLHVGQRVRVLVERTQVVITPFIDSQLTLEQRLAAFDPVRHGGEYFAGVCERLTKSSRWVNEFGDEEWVKRDKVFALEIIGSVYSRRCRRVCF